MFKNQTKEVLRLLLAEDNPGDVGLVREAIRTCGVDTNLTVAKDGEQALTHLRNSKFNLVILDLNLPRQDGQTILQLCATADGSPPFVVFSGSERPSDRELALLAGAREYVVKPCGFDEFIERVQQMVKRWSCRQDSIPEPRE